MPGPQEFIINYRDCSHCVKFSGCRRSNICCTLFSRSIAMCPFQVTANCIKILTGTSYLIGMASHYLLFRVINVRSFGVLCIKVFHLKLGDRQLSQDPQDFVMHSGTTLVLLKLQKLAMSSTEGKSDQYSELNNDLPQLKYGFSILIFSEVDNTKWDGMIVKRITIMV